MGVELASIVVGSQVNLGLVKETNNHDIIRGRDVGDTEKGASRHDAGAVAVLGAPGNLISLGNTNGIILLGRGPQTEVWDQRSVK